MNDKTKTGNGKGKTKGSAGPGRVEMHGSGRHFRFFFLDALFRGRKGIVFRTVTFLVAWSFFWPAVPNARASDRGGERPAPYLRLAAGGRPTALGGAGASLPGGLGTVVLNPALLTGVRTFQVSTQYAFLTEDRTFASVQLGNRLERSPLSYAISWIHFGAGGDLEAREAPSAAPLYTFSDSQMAFLVTAAYRLDADWSVGVGLKVLTHWLDEDFGWGFGEDLGVTRRLSRDTRVGLAIQDLLSELSFPQADSEKIPPTVRAGVTHLFYGPQVIVTADLAFSADGGVEPCGGAEWRAGSGLSVRAGWGRGLFSGGFGLSTSGSRLASEFEYTLSQDALVEGSLLHRVGLGLRFL